MKQYEPRVIALANELAEALDDRESLNAYLFYADKYKEEYLYKILEKVLSIPHKDIRKTRGALFTYLLTNHGKRQEYSGD